MCILCYTLVGEEHWTDAPVGGRPPASVRAHRRAVLKTVLGARGLDYGDDPSGVTAVMSDRKGSTAVVRGLAEVWAAAEDLSHQPLDPLDPALLRRLAELSA
jgi:hypothetical protein